MIATANKVSAQTQGGRKNLSPAIIHRCNKIDLKGLTEYTAKDIQKIIVHQKEQGLIDTNIEINSDLIEKVQAEIVNNTINLRNLSAWANENYGGKAIEEEEIEIEFKKEYKSSIQEQESEMSQYRQEEVLKYTPATRIEPKACWSLFTRCFGQRN